MMQEQERWLAGKQCNMKWVASQEAAGRPDNDGARGAGSGPPALPLSAQKEDRDPASASWAKVGSTKAARCTAWL